MGKTIEEIKTEKLIAEGKIESIIAQFSYDNQLYDISVDVDITKICPEGRNCIGIGVSTKIEIKI